MDIPALGPGPVSITLGGAHKVVSLRAIKFVDGKPQTAFGDSAEKPKIEAWLNHLASLGMLKPQPIIVAPAFALKAVKSGAWGNGISVNITKMTPNADLSKTTIEVAVTVGYSYQGLTPATIAKVLGTGPGSGDKPGLVFVKHVDPNQPMPAATSAAAIDDPPEVEIKSAAGQQAFLLAAESRGKADTFTVEIKDVAAEAFTLAVTWIKKAEVELGAFNDEFGFVLASDPPDTFKALPAVGQTKLSGGVDPVTPPSRPGESAGGNVLTI